MPGFLRPRDVGTGMLIYASGDTIAALVLGEFAILRLVGMILVGGLLYAIEIPAWFRMLERRFPMEPRPGRAAVARTLGAILFFNPLWIARHLLFVRIFEQAWEQITWEILRVGLYSFGAALPVSLVANYLIQTATPLRWRFAASASFSALMAVYYAVSLAWFG